MLFNGNPGPDVGDEIDPESWSDENRRPDEDDGMDWDDKDLRED